MQSEKTGEAVLSMFLQVYGLFYVTDHTSYWTASLSLILSAGGITYGCYIYFDLAVVFGETCAEIVPSQEAAIELEPAQVESPISSPPQAPPMMSVEPVSKGNKDKLEVHNAEKFQDEIKAFITQNSKVVPAQAENPQGAAPTLVGAKQFQHHHSKIQQHHAAPSVILYKDEVVLNVTFLACPDRKPVLEGAHASHYARTSQFTKVLNMMSLNSRSHQYGCDEISARFVDAVAKICLLAGKGET